MAQGYTATDLSKLVATSTEVLCSYEDVRLSTSTTAPPKKPSVKALLRVCTFTDVKQRTRFTFLKNGHSGKVLADAVLLSLEGSRTDEKTVELRFYDFGESEPQGPAVQTSQRHRPVNPQQRQRQHVAEPQAAVQSAVRSDITLDAAFATAGRAKQLDDNGKLTAAVLAYEQCSREFQAVVANAEKNKLSAQHVELILSKARAFAARAAAIRQHVATASSTHDVAAVTASTPKTWGSSQNTSSSIAPPRSPLPAATPAASVEDQMLQRLAELQAKLPPEDNTSNHQDKQHKFLRRIENLKENATRQHDEQRKNRRHANNGSPGETGGGAGASAENGIDRDDDDDDDDAVHVQLMKRLDLMKRSLEDSIRTQDAEKAQAQAKLKDEFKPGTRVRVVAAQQLRSLIEAGQDPRVGLSWDDRLKLLGGREGVVCSHVFEPGASPLFQVDVSVVLPSSRRKSTARVLLFPEALVKRHWWDAPTSAPAAAGVDDGDESTASSSAEITREDSDPAAASAGNAETSERSSNSEPAAGADAADSKSTSCRPRPADGRDPIQRPGSQTATVVVVRAAAPTTAQGCGPGPTTNKTSSPDSSTVAAQPGAAVEELEVAEDVGPDQFVSNSEAGCRRRAVVRDQSDDDDDVSDALWARVERVAEAVEDCVTDTEDLMRESTSDRMNEVRRRRQAITKLSRLSQQLEAVLAAAGRTSSTISAHGQTRVAAAQTLNDAKRALAIYEVEFPPEVETVEARRSNAGKVGSQAFGITAGVVGGAAAVATAGVAVAGGIAAPRLAGIATVGTALAGGVAAVTVGAVVGGTAAAVAAIDHAVKRDRAKKRRQRQAARVGYDWSDDDGLQDDYSEDEQSVDSDGSAY